MYTNDSYTNIIQWHYSTYASESKSQILAGYTLKDSKKPCLLRFNTGDVKCHIHGSVFITSFVHSVNVELLHM